MLDFPDFVEGCQAKNKTKESVKVVFPESVKPTNISFRPIVVQSIVSETATWPLNNLTGVRKEKNWSKDRRGVEKTGR